MALPTVARLEKELKKLEKSGIDPGADVQATMLALADKISLIIRRQTSSNSINTNSKIGSGRKRKTSLVAPTTPAVTRRQSSAAVTFSSLRARKQQEEVKEGTLKDMVGGYIICIYIYIYICCVVLCSNALWFPSYFYFPKNASKTNLSLFSGRLFEPCGVRVLLHGSNYTSK